MIPEVRMVTALRRSPAALKPLIIIAGLCSSLFALVSPVAGFQANAATAPITAVDLGTLGGIESQATAVNNSGQVVGYGRLANYEYHAFSWTQAGGMIDLGTLGGGTFSSAVAVNASGQVVGFSTNTAQPYFPLHAFSWTQAGGMIDLGTLGGGTFSV